MQVLITNTFKRAVKKLHCNQIKILEDAIEALQIDPTAGESKVGDLAGIRVYKFYILKQHMLLAYAVDQEKNELTLLSLGSHENFYTNLKRQLKN